MASSARSASYAGGKTSASQSRKTTVGATIDRRVERNTVQTREYYTVRSKSPAKPTDPLHGSKKAREPVAAKVDLRPNHGGEPQNGRYMFARIL
jgi:hypothetical protein